MEPKIVDCIGFESTHEVDEDGNIFSKSRKIRNCTKKRKHLTPSDNGLGYLQINMCVDRKSYKRYVHRLVYESFNGTLGPYEEVNHIDHNKQNNALSNLEAVTHKENINKMFQHHLQDDDFYLSRIQKEREENDYFRCKKCGNKTSVKISLCRECFNYENSKHIPSKEQLFKLLSESSFEDVARSYGVSSNTIRHWCTRRGIPRHAKYYKGNTELSSI